MKRFGNIARNVILVLAAIGAVVVLVADPTSRPVAAAILGLFMFWIIVGYVVAASRRRP